jgi:hypothetical protein
LITFGHLVNILACFTATSVKSFPALSTLNKKQVAGVIVAIGMRVGGFAALVAMSNHFS